jgi:alkylresorcinol/alkylpyrone synthase
MANRSQEHEMHEQSRAAEAVRTEVGPGQGLARIVGAGHAVPAAVGQRELWDDFFDAHWAGNPLARKIWSMTGIETRHFVIDPRTEQDAVEWGTGARMRRYLDEAMPLGDRAVRQALEQSGIAAEDVGLFAVVSCTGYVTPGLDILLARDLGMSPDVQRLLIGHMGCYAAMPGLAAVSDYVQSRGRPAVLLCLELTSLHGQPATETIRSGRQTYDDVQQIVAHALFSDAASAVVLAPETAAGADVSLPGFEVRDFVARTDAESTEHMAWEVTDQGFKMMLSPQVPDVLAVHVERVVRDLLGRNGLTIDDVAAWAVHPGGRRILEVVAEQLDLGEAAMAPSYDVLRDYGNCSSATVLLVVEQLLADGSIASGDHVVAMAFGPGLTLYASLLRRR